MSPNCKNADELIICPECKEWTTRCEPCCPGTPSCEECADE